MQRYSVKRSIFQGLAHFSEHLNVLILISENHSIFLDEQTGKAAFTGWPPVLIFSKEREKEKRVYVCGRER